MRRMISSKFLASDLTVAINSTVVDGVGFNSESPILGSSDYASISIFVKGNHASCSKEVIFKFASYSKALDKWDTVPYLTKNVVASGTSDVVVSVPLTPDIEKIKLLSVQNQETVAGYTVTINASIFIKEQ